MTAGWMRQSWPAMFCDWFVWPLSCCKVLYIHDAKVYHFSLNTELLWILTIRSCRFLNMVDVSLGIKIKQYDAIWGVNCLKILSFWMSLGATISSVIIFTLVSFYVTKLFRMLFFMLSTPPEILDCQSHSHPSLSL